MQQFLNGGDGDVAIRPKSRAVIARDALMMAERKLNEGCDACAQGYVDLALRNGARQETLPRILVPFAKKGLLGGLSVSGLEIVTNALSARSAAASPSVPTSKALVLADPNQLLPQDWKTMDGPRRLEIAQELVAAHMPANRDPYIGCDGSTGVYPPNDYFYIGEMGYGQCANCGPCGGACFNTVTANAAGYSWTHGYWGLQGPGSRPGTISTNYDWGANQGNNAVVAWRSGAYAAYLGGTTIFCDVEDGFGGWNSLDQTGNVDVLNGFIDAVYNQSFTPGVYINTGWLGTYFPPGYAPHHPFAFWATGNVEGYAECGTCNPCGCDPMTTLTNEWNGGAYHQCFGGQGIVIWQFWISNCGCGDFNYSPQTGYLYFSPTGCS